ncbi:MAG: hypothetical protein R3322_00375 [Kiloniellales bacterium]|nr:hypothetical protein [Kiloniellales bacterium]
MAKKDTQADTALVSATLPANLAPRGEMAEKVGEMTVLVGSKAVTRTVTGDDVDKQVRRALGREIGSAFQAQWQADAIANRLTSEAEVVNLPVKVVRLRIAQRARGMRPLVGDE